MNVKFAGNWEAVRDPQQRVVVFQGEDNARTGTLTDAISLAKRLSMEKLRGTWEFVLVRGVSILIVDENTYQIRVTGEPSMSNYHEDMAFVDKRGGDGQGVDGEQTDVCR